MIYACIDNEIYMSFNANFKPEATEKQKTTAIKALLKIGFGFIPKTVRCVSEDEFNKTEVEKKDAAMDSINNQS